MNIRLDWVAYYKRFKQVHGGNPVEVNGYLLFQDGWRYSNDNVEGPEYAPPTDKKELQKLQRDYWEERERVVQGELTALERSRHRLMELQSMKSAPLQHVVYQEDGEGLRRREVVDLELQDTDGRVQWLQSDLHECKRTLQGLSNDNKNDDKSKAKRSVQRFTRPTIAKQYQSR